MALTRTEQNSTAIPGFFLGLPFSFAADDGSLLGRILRHTFGWGHPGRRTVQVAVRRPPVVRPSCFSAIGWLWPIHAAQK